MLPKKNFFKGTFLSLTAVCLLSNATGIKIYNYPHYEDSLSKSEKAQYSSLFQFTKGLCCNKKFCIRTLKDNSLMLHFMEDQGASNLFLQYPWNIKIQSSILESNYKVLGTAFHKDNFYALCHKLNKDESEIVLRIYKTTNDDNNSLALEFDLEALICSYDLPKSLKEEAEEKPESDVISSSEGDTEDADSTTAKADAQVESKEEVDENMQVGFNLNEVPLHINQDDLMFYLPSSDDEVKRWRTYSTINNEPNFEKVAPLKEDVELSASVEDVLVYTVKNDDTVYTFNCKDNSSSPLFKSGGKLTSLTMNKNFIFALNDQGEITALGKDSNYSKMILTQKDLTGKPRAIIADENHLVVDISSTQANSIDLMIYPLEDGLDFDCAYRLTHPISEQIIKNNNSKAEDNTTENKNSTEEIIKEEQLEGSRKIYLVGAEILYSIGEELVPLCLPPTKATLDYLHTSYEKKCLPTFYSRSTPLVVYVNSMMKIKGDEKAEKSIDFDDNSESIKTLSSETKSDQQKWLPRDPDSFYLSEEKVSDLYGKSYTFDINGLKRFTYNDTSYRSYFEMDKNTRESFASEIMIDGLRCMLQACFSNDNDKVLLQSAFEQLVCLGEPVAVSRLLNLYGQYYVSKVDSIESWQREWFISPDLVVVAEIKDQYYIQKNNDNSELEYRDSMESFPKKETIEWYEPLSDKAGYSLKLKPSYKIVIGSYHTGEEVERKVEYFEPLPNDMGYLLKLKSPVFSSLSNGIEAIQKPSFKLRQLIQNEPVTKQYLVNKVIETALEKDDFQAAQGTNNTKVALEGVAK